MEIRKTITDIYALIGEEGIKAEDAHTYTLNDEEDECELLREHHALYEYSMFAKLPRGMIGNDSGQPWMLYWLSNALEVTNQHQMKLKPDQKARCCSYLRQCHNSIEGGFSGQPGIQTHVASTYAAMMAIVNIGTKEAYDIIDRPKMKAYLNRIKNNLDTTHEQSDPHNVWVFKDR